MKENLYSKEKKRLLIKIDSALREKFTLTHSTSVSNGMVVYCFYNTID